MYAIRSYYDIGPSLRDAPGDAVESRFAILQKGNLVVIEERKLCEFLDSFIFRKGIGRFDDIRLDLLQEQVKAPLHFGQISAPGAGVAVEFAAARITSYNVCYTKLLRKSFNGD